MLLNYKQLRSNLEYKDCIGKVMIVCYTIQDTNISIFGNLGSLEFLKNNNAQGYNGEIFIEENIIYCAVGQLNNDEFQEKDSWEIQRSMGAVWKKISQYYNKYEVEFNEWNGVSNCYYGFILASYKYVYLNKENQTAQIQLNLIINEKYRDIILDEIEKNLKPGPAYYDIEEYTDQTIRQLAEETIREKALKILQDEVPHGIYVEVEKMNLRKNKQNEDIYDIEATIYCLRDSHKGIIIGKNGEMLKRIGRAARIDMEQNFGLKVNLKTWVKVKKDWLDNDSIVNKFKLK